MQCVVQTNLGAPTTHVRSDVTALPAEGHDDVHEEEGQPADDEGRHDDRHRPRRLPLLRQRYLQQYNKSLSTTLSLSPSEVARTMNK